MDSETTYRDIVVCAEKYIIEHITDNDIRLDDFCSQVNWTRRSVQRAFQHFGTSWRSSLNKARIGEARRELLCSTKTVDEIARGVGFVERPQFSKAFKQQTGMTPSQYRNQGYQHVAA